MKLKTQLKSLAFLYNIFSNGGCILPSDKPLFPPDNSSSFAEALPEQEGIRSSGLLDMFTALSADRHINPHSAIILRNGKLIAKADWSPYTSALPHVSHSLAKSVTSMAVGIAIKEKYLSLDETLSDIFEKTDKKIGSITVENLLTMSSGVTFNEASSLLSRNWVEGFLASDMTFESGTTFHYNSMNSYMLSAILCRKIGISLSEYLSRRLFSPMGITRFHWEKCPSGIEKGGWGLYLSPFDYAKLGQLWLDKGKWNNVQLIPKVWIEIASAPHIAHQTLCSSGYGYQVWIGKHGSIFSGMFGQLVYIIPNRNMVIVLTAGSENLFPCSNTLKYIDQFLDNDDFFSNSPFTDFHYADTAALRKSLSSARFGNPLDTSASNLFSRLKSLLPHKNTSPENILDGIEIELAENRAHILPVLIQVMDGCFGNGIEKAAFLLNDNKLHLRLTLNGDITDIPIGFEMPFQFTYNGYAISSQGFFTTDEDDLPVLKIQLCFLESSCTKILKFLFTDSGVTLKFRESPTLYSALDEASVLTKPQLGNTLRRTLEAVLESDIADYKIKSFIEPNIEGKYKLST